MASKNRRNKVKFKFTKELGFLLLALAVIGGVTIGLAIPTRAERELSELNNAITEYNTANETEYTTLDTDTHVKVISYDDMVSLKNSNGLVIVWYGSLTDGTFLSALYGYDMLAMRYDVDSVYVSYPTYFEEAAENETKNTIEYNQTKKEMEDKLNNGREAKKEIDLETYNSFFVFKDGKLVFNSQSAGTSTQYSSEALLYKAFSYAK